MLQHDNRHETLLSFGFVIPAPQTGSPVGLLHIVVDIVSIADFASMYLPALKGSFSSAIDFALLQPGSTETYFRQVDSLFLSISILFCEGLNTLVKNASKAPRTITMSISNTTVSIDSEIPFMIAMILFVSWQ